MKVVKTFPHNPMKSLKTPSNRESNKMKPTKQHFLFRRRLTVFRNARVPVVAHSIAYFLCPSTQHEKLRMLHSREPCPTNTYNPLV
jgi:hypothetical protein